MDNNLIFNRYLASNYWNCPVLNYSKIDTNDYDIAKQACGKNINKHFFLFV